jgi:hypothetical protein
VCVPGGELEFRHDEDEFSMSAPSPESKVGLVLPKSLPSSEVVGEEAGPCPEEENVILGNDQKPRMKACMIDVV